MFTITADIPATAETPQALTALLTMPDESALAWLGPRLRTSRYRLVKSRDNGDLPNTMTVGELHALTSLARTTAPARPTTLGRIMGLPPIYADAAWKRRLHPIEPSDILGPRLPLGFAPLNPLDLSLSLLVRDSDVVSRSRASAATRRTLIVSAMTALGRGDVDAGAALLPAEVTDGRDVDAVAEALVEHEMAKATSIYRYMRAKRGLDLQDAWVA